MHNMTGQFNGLGEPHDDEAERRTAHDNSNAIGRERP
jgi:hypothetical protein